MKRRKVKSTRFSGIHLIPEGVSFKILLKKVGVEDDHVTHYKDVLL